MADNRIQIEIYDATGGLVKSFPLLSDYSLLPTGVVWDGRDDSGRLTPSGSTLSSLMQEIVEK